jgi:transposase, IS30 family
MWVSTETICQSLYVQSRGALRRNLVNNLRTGRALRVPNRQGTQRKNRVLPDMINMQNVPPRLRGARHATALSGPPRTG